MMAARNVVGVAESVVPFVDEAYHRPNEAVHCWVEDARGSGACCLQCAVRRVGQGASAETRLLAHCLLRLLDEAAVVGEVVRRGLATGLLTLLFDAGRCADGDARSVSEDLAVAFAAGCPGVVASPAFVNAFRTLLAACEGAAAQEENLVRLLSATMAQCPGVADLFPITGARVLHALSLFLHPLPTRPDQPPQYAHSEQCRAGVVYVLMKVAHTASVVEVFAHLGATTGLFTHVTACLQAASPGSALSLNTVALLNTCSKYPAIVRLFPLDSAGSGSVSLPAAISRVVVQKQRHVQKALVHLLHRLCGSGGGGGSRLAARFACTTLPEYLLECIGEDDSSLVVATCELLAALHTAEAEEPAAAAAAEPASRGLALSHALESAVQHAYSAHAAGDGARTAALTALVAALLDVLERRAFKRLPGPATVRAATAARLVNLLQMLVMGGEEDEAGGADAAVVAGGIRAMSAALRLWGDSDSAGCTEMLRVAVSRCAAVRDETVLVAMVELLDCASEHRGTARFVAATFADKDAAGIYAQAFAAAAPPLPLLCSLVSLAANALSPAVQPHLAPRLLTFLLAHTRTLPPQAASISVVCLGRLLSLANAACLTAWDALLADSGTAAAAAEGCGTALLDPACILQAVRAAAASVAGGDVAAACAPHLVRCVDVLLFDVEWSEHASFDPTQVFAAVLGLLHAVQAALCRGAGDIDGDSDVPLSGDLRHVVCACAEIAAAVADRSAAAGASGAVPVALLRRTRLQTTEAVTRWGVRHAGVREETAFLACGDGFAAAVAGCADVQPRIAVDILRLVCDGGPVGDEERRGDDVRRACVACLKEAVAAGGGSDEAAACSAWSGRPAAVECLEVMASWVRSAAARVAGAASALPEDLRVAAGVCEAAAVCVDAAADAPPAALDVVAAWARDAVVAVCDAVAASRAASETQRAFVAAGLALLARRMPQGCCASTFACVLRSHVLREQVAAACAETRTLLLSLTLTALQRQQEGEDAGERCRCASCPSVCLRSLLVPPPRSARDRQLVCQVAAAAVGGGGGGGDPPTLPAVFPSFLADCWAAGPEDVRLAVVELLACLPQAAADVASKHPAARFLARPGVSAHTEAMRTLLASHGRKRSLGV